MSWSFGILLTFRTYSVLSLLFFMAQVCLGDLLPLFFLPTKALHALQVHSQGLLLTGSYPPAGFSLL